MVKQRKDRVGGEFIGFGAFADPTPQHSAASSTPGVTSWSPVYMGSNNDFRSLFQRISQKRDRITLTKAIRDLQALFRSTELPKKVQAEALQHWAWLYHTKMGAVESNPSVRAEAVQVWFIAADRIPKVVGNIVEEYSELLGMLLLAQTDPSGEVRGVAHSQQPVFQKDLPWEKGLLKLTHRLLSYGRPSVMEESFFPKQTGEPDRDAMEERFVRLVGNSIDALSKWIGENGTENEETIWWKYLTSSKSALRFKTYSLLSAAASKAPGIIPSLQKRLPELVSSEKEPMNVVCLLETIVVVLVHGDGVVDPLLVKSLVKLFRKGCNRSPCDQWGPMVLPIVVKMNRSTEILKAVKEGVSTLVSDNDRFAVWTAVCETALLCNQLELWSEGFHFALTTTGYHRTAATARANLLNQLAQQVTTNPNLDLSELLQCPKTLLAEFVGILAQQTNRRFIPEIHQRGLQIVEQARGSSPEEDDYLALRSVLDYIGPSELFSSELSLDEFVNVILMNWTILHAKETRNTLLTNSFEVLYSCLAERNQEPYWGRFLSGLISTQCPLASLSKGLMVLGRGRSQGANAKWLQCSALDEFAVEVGNRSIQLDDTTDYDDLLEFFQILLGSLGGPLIEVSTSCKLVNLVADGTSPDGSPLLESLLLQFNRQLEFLDRPMLQQVVLCSWRSVRTSLFNTNGRALVEHDSDLRADLIYKATQELNDTIMNSLESYDAGSLWVARASSILSFIYQNGDDLPGIGFESLERWKRHTPGMFQLLMLLFECWGEPTNHLAFINTYFSGREMSRLVDLLLLLSEVSYFSLQDIKIMKRQDRCARILRIISSSSDGEELCKRIATAILDAIPKSLDDELALRKHVAVLFQVLDCCFLPLVSDKEYRLEAETVKEGDEVQYITDPLKPQSSQAAKVLKVHYDVQAGYFFTLLIEEGEGEGTQERQTVLDRLRRKDYSVDSKIFDFIESLSQEQLSQRKFLCEKLLADVILPRHSLVAKSRAIGELLSVTISHIGLGPTRGIGSLHYDVLKCIRETQETAKMLVEKRDVGGLVVCLHSLALVFGFGSLSRESLTPIVELKLDPTPLAKLILEPPEFPAELNTALTSWFVICLRLMKSQQIGQTDLQRQLFVALFRLVSNLLSCDRKSTHINHFVACRALLVGVELSGTCNDEEVKGSKDAALGMLLDTFIENKDDPHRHDQVVSLLSFEPLRALFSWLRRPECVELLVGKVEELFQTMYHGGKRPLGFLLMNAVASRKQHLYTHEEVCLSDRTSSNLTRWVGGLQEEEEAAEVEEDVYIVAEWIPREMMSEFEAWRDSSLEDIDDELLARRFLMWLNFLTFADTAMPTEFRVRPAFVSYLEKSGAINELLNLCVVYSETIGKQKAECTLDKLWLLDGGLVNMDEVNDINKLATACLFKTMQIFPSLSKRWWEEECPKSSVVLVESFVERNVTLEILKRELLQMNNSSSFGAMKVSGSTVSREIVAIYEQDDFNLKVVVSVPPCFPLRSAEVDCSKTLGIPASRWKRWSLQIRLMLNNQGGTLQDALILWKDNVDREFDGVEPCPVCYSVLHTKTHKLPSLECTTCHNRFHFDCLTQWFRSSGKNDCVMCQQPWRGTRI